MPITFDCPSCSRELTVKDEMAGKQGRCPACQNVLTVPAQSPPPAPVPAQAFDFEEDAQPDHISNRPQRPQPVHEEEEYEEAPRSSVQRDSQSTLTDPWHKVHMGLQCKLISIWLFIGALGVTILSMLILMSELSDSSSRSFRSSSGSSNTFHLVLLMLCGFSMIGSWVTAIGGYVPASSTPGNHGEQSLAIICLALAAMTMLMPVQIGNLGDALDFRGPRRLQFLFLIFTLSIVVFFPELGRFGVYGFYLRGLGKTLRNRSLESTGLLLGILFPSVNLGLFLIGIAISPKEPSTTFLLQIFYRLVWLGFLIWYALLILRAKRIVARVAK